MLAGTERQFPESRGYAESAGRGAGAYDDIVGRGMPVGGRRLSG